jgi:hypothetical protein
LGKAAANSSPERMAAKTCERLVRLFML